MNNKRGGFGAKFLLVLFLMIIAAGAGAYGYRYFDGQMAIREAKKDIESVDVSDYDTAEATEVQGYIDDATKDLETAQTRKEVYEILEDFNEDVSKVKTAAEKELEEALKAAEEAQKQNAAATDETTTISDEDTDETSSSLISKLLGSDDKDDDDDKTTEEADD